MTLIGHPDIPYDPLYYVETKEQIAQTPSNTTLWLGLWKDAKGLARHCCDHGIRYAIGAETVEEAVLANALHATYIIVDTEMAEAMQKVAETYLFDAKIMVALQDGASFASLARRGIDGVLFRCAILFEWQVRK